MADAPEPRTPTPTPDELRAAISARLDRPVPPRPRRRAITRDAVLGASANTEPAATRAFLVPTGPDGATEVVSADGTVIATASRTYSAANVSRGIPLGDTYTQVSVKLPQPLADTIAQAVVDGVGTSISDVVRQWVVIGAEQYLTTTTERTTTTHE